MRYVLLNYNGLFNLFIINSRRQESAESIDWWKTRRYFMQEAWTNLGA
jgi:hypothetical protein